MTSNSFGSYAATILCLAVFGIAAIACFFFPRKVQQAAIAFSENQSYNPFRDYIRSESYVWFTRLGGVVAMVGFAATVWSIFKS